MPVYGNNSYVLTAVSAKQTITIPAITGSTTDSQIVFSVSGNQFRSYAGGSPYSRYFPDGYLVYLDSYRITIPNLSGVVCSPIGIGGTITTAPYINVNAVGSTTATAFSDYVSAFDTWMPINKLSPAVSGKYDFSMVSLQVYVDWRNADSTVFNNIDIYAQIDLKVNSVIAPSNS